MVIECPACKTKFKLPDEKVVPTGVSVRCSKCATTFSVRRDAAGGATTTVIAPPPAAPTPAPAPATSAPAATPATPFGGTPPTAASPANPFGGGTAPASPANPFGGAPAPAAPPTPFAPGSPAGAPNPFAAGSAPPAVAPNPFAGAPNPFAPAAAPATGAPVNPFAPGAAPQPANPFAPAAGGAPPAPAGGLDPFAAAAFASQNDPGMTAPEAAPSIDPGLRAQLLGGSGPGSELQSEADAGLSTDAEVGAGSFDFGHNVDFGADAAAAAATRPAPPPAELFGARAPAPMPMPPPAPAAPPLRTTREKTDAGGKDRSRVGQKKKPLLRGPGRIAGPREPVAAYRILLALFFAGAAASAYASLTGGTLDPARLDRGRLSLIIGPPSVPESIAGLAIRAENGGYVAASPGRPRVYAAHGVAVNAGSTPKGYLEVRGRLLTDDGEVLAENTVPCGNSFRDDQLLAFRTRDELRRAYTPAGDGLSNAKVAAGTAIPCTVVFFEAPPPERTAAFELEIVSAKPVS